MKLVLSLLAFTTPVVSSSSYDEKVLENQFHGWMKAHGKTYETTEEMLQRMDIWMANNGRCPSAISSGIDALWQYV